MVFTQMSCRTIMKPKNAKTIAGENAVTIAGKNSVSSEANTHAWRCPVTALGPGVDWGKSRK